MSTVRVTLTELGAPVTGAVAIAIVYGPQQSSAAGKAQPVTRHVSAGVAEVRSWYGSYPGYLNPGFLTSIAHFPPSLSP
jgi:hypothetical protein